MILLSVFKGHHKQILESSFKLKTNIFSFLLLKREDFIFF